MRLLCESSHTRNTSKCAYWRSIYSHHSKTYSEFFFYTIFVILYIEFKREKLNSRASIHGKKKNSLTTQHTRYPQIKGLSRAQPNFVCIKKCKFFFSSLLSVLFICYVCYWFLLYNRNFFFSLPMITMIFRCR